jgi:hypothetical protein
MIRRLPLPLVCSATVLTVLFVQAFAQQPSQGPSVPELTFQINQSTAALAQTIYGLQQLHAKDQSQIDDLTKQVSDLKAKLPADPPPPPK